MFIRFLIFNGILLQIVWSVLCTQFMTSKWPAPNSNVGLPHSLFSILEPSFMSTWLGKSVHSMRAVGHVILVTRWLISSFAYKSWQSFMISHRAVDHLNSWDSPIVGWSSRSAYVDWWVSTVQLINCPLGYHNGLSGLICRAPSQPPSYRESLPSKAYLLPDP